MRVSTLKPASLGPALCALAILTAAPGRAAEPDRGKAVKIRKRTAEEKKPVKIKKSELEMKGNRKKNPYQ